MTRRWPRPSPSSGSWRRWSTPTSSRSTTSSSTTTPATSSWSTSEASPCGRSATATARSRRRRCPWPRRIAYILEILPAFGYLHRRGLLFCDFKPDNVIQTEERLKLIDLGGVRSVTDDDTATSSARSATRRPRSRRRGHRSAPTSTPWLARLAVLSIDLARLPGPEALRHVAPRRPAGARLRALPSFHQFLAKATAAEPTARFQSAEDMAEQLFGVLRQVVATDGGSPPPTPAATSPASWATAIPRRTLAPAPRPTVDPFDPAAGFLATAALPAPTRSSPSSRRRHAASELCSISLGPGSTRASSSRPPTCSTDPRPARPAGGRPGGEASSSSRPGAHRTRA